MSLLSTYPGSGDSGGVEGVTFEAAGGQSFDGLATAKVQACQSHFANGQWNDFFL